MVKKILTSKNIRQKVFEEVRKYVTGDYISPGSKVDEDLLSRGMGVSKTPIREAISRLAHEGIVEIVPNRGAFKIRLSKKDFSDILVIRQPLETLCLRLTISNIDGPTIKKLKTTLDDFERRNIEDDFLQYPLLLDKFYGVIYETTKNPRLVRIVRSLNDLTQTFRLFYFNSPERVRNSIAIHKALIGALEKRDIELAVEIRLEMLQTASKFLMERIFKTGGSMTTRADQAELSADD